jgi:hypothetical protein
LYNFNIYVVDFKGFFIFDLYNIYKKKGIFMKKKEDLMTTTRKCGFVTNLTHIDLNKAINVLKERDCIDKWCYIIHNKDVYHEEDLEGNEKAVLGQSKADHIHVGITFKSPQHAKNIAKWFDIPIGRLQKIKSNFANFIDYFTHQQPENEHKHQYEESEVQCNFVFSDEVAKKTKSNRLTNKKMEELIIVGQIESQKIRKHNRTDFITIEQYNTHKKAIDNAFLWVQEELEKKLGEKDMNVIYINGKSQSGKTTYAKMIATNFCKDNNLPVNYYVSSSSNDVLDGYKDQDVLILDDLRSDSMTFPNLLKMLDNNTSSSISSRYSNKNLNYCKLIIITQTQSIDTFFNVLKGIKNEDITQLKRRCSTNIKLTERTMDYYVYDEVKRDYVIEMENMVNPALEVIMELREKNKDKKIKTLSIMGSLKKAPIHNDDIPDLKVVS